jgi:ElaB/YqjD/DUF883 family membrane-anchored ribosome-binding protein
MKIRLVDPVNGKEKFFDVSEFQVNEAIANLNPVVSSSKLKKELDLLSGINKGEIKSVLEKVSEHVSELGNWSFKIGHKIVEIAISFVKRYPNASAGLLIGAVIGLVISSIPVVGFLIGWLVTPLLAAMGLGIGCWMDIKDKELQSKIKEEVFEIFDAFQNIKAVA